MYSGTDTVPEQGSGCYIKGAEQGFDITAYENDDIDTLIGDSDRNNLLDDIQSRIGLEHPIVYDTYDLCAYHKEGKLRALSTFPSKR